MSDTFGSGLQLPFGAPSQDPAAGQSGGSGADVTPAPAPDAPKPSGGLFGSGLHLGPSYRTPDANASAIDQSADILQQRIQRANQIATNPIAQFFDPEGVQRARDFVSKAPLELQQLQQAGAKQQEVKKLAANYGITNIPQGADRETATNLIADELQQRYLNGDPLAAQGLAQLGRSDLVQAGGEQALSAAAENNKRYRDAVSKLSAAPNPGQYDAAYKQLQQETVDGTHTAAELASVPKTFEEFQKKKQQIGNALSVQQMQIEAQRARMQQLAGVTPIQKTTDKDGNATGMHAAISSQVTDNNGQPMAGVEPVTVGGVYNGNRLPSGSDKIGDAGMKWGLLPSSEVKEINTRLEPHKAGIERAAGINKLDDIAQTKDFGTNPWLLGHGIDQFVEISRNGVGGKGSATPGTITIMENLRGTLQMYSDKVQKEWGRVVDWVDNGRKGPQPYMSPDTINALKSAVKTLRTASDAELAGTVGNTAYYVGRHGGRLADMSLEPNVMDAVKPYWQNGNNDFKKDIASRPSVVMGGQRILFDRAGVHPSTAIVPGGFDSEGDTPQQHSGTAPRSAAVSGVENGGPKPGGGAPQQQQQPSAPPAGGSTPGRYGLPPGMALDNDAAVTAAANRSMQIESGFKPGQTTGSYRGLGQWSDAEMKRHGITNPDDVEQNRAALKTDIQARAAKLQKDGLPATAANVYLMHQQGEAGAEAHLRNPDSVAWQNVRQFYKSDAVAKQAVWGNMTPEMRRQFPNGVDGVKSGDFTRLWEARYNGTDNGKADIASAAGRRTGLASLGRTAPRDDAQEPSGFMDRVRNMVRGAQQAGQVKTGLESMTPEQVQAAADRTAGALPAIGSTVGALGGTALGGPLGGAAGGAIGGGAGQAVKDYLQGNKQDPVKIAEQTALGGVLGVVSPARPIAAAAGRVLGSAAIEGGAEAAKGGDVSDVVKEAAKGGAYALGGEALGRFVSSAGATAYKALSRYTTSAQQELSAYAGKLAEARKILETEPPKLPGEGAGANPKYEAAKKAADDATQAIKDHGQNPDDMVHAYEQAKAGTSAGEAAVMRKAASEKTAVTQGYDELRQSVKEAGVGTPKPNQSVPNGPVAQVRTAENPTGKVDAKFLSDAEHAELLVKAPAPNGWGEKWQQLQDAGSELIKKRLNFLANNDKVGAKAMDDIFQGVRNQQKAAAKYVFGDEKGAEVIKNLESLDQRYAKVMNATQGMNYDRMRATLAGGNTPERRELEKNFREFAKDDPTAIRAFNAMKAGAKGDWKSEAALMGPVIAGEVAANLHGVPTVGVITALVGGHRLYKLMQGYMNAKVLGRDVTFKDFLAQEVKSSGILDTVRTASQRAALQQ